MKNKILLLAIGLLLPILASAQLITSAQTITVKEKKPEKLLHYEQSIEFTAATDFQDKGGDRSVYGLEYIGGIRFNNLFFLGAGIGLNFHSFSDDFVPDTTSDWDRYISRNCPENLVSVPLYLHTRLYFTHTRCQPFFSLSIGGLLSGNREIENLHDVSYNPSAFFINPAVGLNFRGEACDFYVTAGLLLHNKVDWIEFWNYEMELERGWYGSLSFNLGVTF